MGASVKDKFKKINYSGVKLLLIYCNYIDFNYYEYKHGNSTIVCINSKLNNREKSDILHKVIKQNMRKRKRYGKK